MRSNPLCAAALATALLLSSCDSGVAVPPDPVIAPGALLDRIGTPEAPLVLDVRTPAEYARGHIPGAVNIPHDALPARLADLPIAKDDEVVVHCHSGRRARAAAETLREGGYSNVRDLSGHWQGWQDAGHPVEGGG